MKQQLEQTAMKSAIRIVISPHYEDMMMVDHDRSGRERELGPRHSDALTSVGNLAHLLDTVGRFDEAEQLYDRACNGFQTTLWSEASNNTGMRRALARV